MEFLIFSFLCSNNDLIIANFDDPAKTACYAFRIQTPEIRNSTEIFSFLKLLFCHAWAIALSPLVWENVEGS